MGTLSKDDLTAMVADLEVEMRDAKVSEGEQSRRYRQAREEHALRARQRDRIVDQEKHARRFDDLSPMEAATAIVDEVEGQGR
jgi:uncharacterized surface protein with fasciclin (FAS1) repeats